MQKKIFFEIAKIFLDFFTIKKNFRHRQIIERGQTGERLAVDAPFGKRNFRLPKPGRQSFCRYAERQRTRGRDAKCVGDFATVQISFLFAAVDRKKYRKSIQKLFVKAHGGPDLDP